jgi:hypothetical protein
MDDFRNQSASMKERIPTLKKRENKTTKQN